MAGRLHRVEIARRLVVLLGCRRIKKAITRNIVAHKKALTPV